LVYYETINREVNKRLINECRCDERPKVKDERSTLLVYTGLHGGLEHLKIETRLINERFANMMGECVIVTSKGSPSIFKVIHSDVVLVRMFPILDLRCEENTVRR
jgi:hypothetical protein